jgi:hypothetical protein
LRKLPTSLHTNKCTADRNGSTTRYRDAGKKRNRSSATFQQNAR